MNAAPNSIGRRSRFTALKGDRLGTARATAALGFTLLNARRDSDGMEVLLPALAEFADLWPDPVIAEMKVHGATGLRANGR